VRQSQYVQSPVLFVHNNLAIRHDFSHSLETAVVETSMCLAAAFCSKTVCSALTSFSGTSTTLSPNAAAISSSVLCLVSLQVSR